MLLNLALYSAAKWLYKARFATTQHHLRQSMLTCHFKILLCGLAPLGDDTRIVRTLAQIRSFCVALKIVGLFRSIEDTRGNAEGLLHS